MLLTIHLKPSARANRLVSWLDETTLKAEVTAPPEKGKANAALIDLLSKTFSMPKKSFTIVRGATTRIKHVDALYLTAEKIARYHNL